MKENEIELLGKGLKFIPKPSKIDKKSLLEALSKFKRRLKIMSLFHSDKRKPDPLNLLLRSESTWDTPDENISYDFAKKFKSLEQKIVRMSTKQNKKLNLTPKERKAIKSLRRNKNIVIKPADKGTSVIIMDKTKYVEEGERQLSNEKFYKPIDEPIHPSVKETYMSIVDTIESKKLLTKKQAVNLELPPEPRSRKFYLLPKIHKEQSKWHNNIMPPGRPIVSDCGSDTYKLSTYIDYYLSPLASKHPSYIKDTSDFLQKLSCIKPNPNSLLITLDVESLYTNIDNNAGLNAIQDAFDNSPNDQRPDEEILLLLSNSLKNNDFIFNDKWYLQVGGTAMGKKFAPNYANIFMAKWEKEALIKSPKQPQTYFRYLDDIFIIWPYSEDEFLQFFDILNSHDNNIKLKYTIAEYSIDFLDVTIFKGNQFYETGQLDSKVFFKPTDTHELLHKNSYHPKHTFRSIIKSQLIRFHRICTHKVDFDQACSTLFRALRTRGYSQGFLRKIKRDTLFGLTHSGIASRCNETRCKICPYIVQTNTISDSNSLPIRLQHKLDCNSTHVIYLIECSNCNIRYIGETSRKLKDRINQHRSDIKNKCDTPVANHFTQVCYNINFLQVIPLDHIERAENDSRVWKDKCRPLTKHDFYAEDIRLEKINENRLIDKEHQWINKLKTLKPNGLNLRTEMGPPIPLTIIFCDCAPMLSKLIGRLHFDLKTEYGYFRRHNMITAYKRNKNLKDILVSASLP